MLRFLGAILPLRLRPTFGLSFLLRVSMKQFSVLEFPAPLKLFRNPRLRVSQNGASQNGIANGFA
ncbi:hypothetical protein AE618_06675 [Bosea vaviloviae]|uniref:Uncharacterized protein n=1 Tax=Bosea vaviloviae TaxID=1526658 RepID=A0A0N0MCZ1_9HYPH|nr:hypothetical protein AE618_06675 [Bosea vaviloviae]